MKNYTVESFQIRNPWFVFLCAVKSIRFYGQRIKNVKKKYNKIKLKKIIIHIYCNIYL